VPLMAAALEDLVVHIECTGPKGKTSYGSGVPISADGHLLTAKHVVADGAECIGGIGSIEAEKMPLEPISQSLKYDGMVLKLDAKTPRHASYCALTRKMQGRDIRVLAFHPGSVRGPSEAEGIVSGGAFNAVSEKIDMLTPADKLAAIAPLKESESCEAVIDGYSVEDHQRILHNWMRWRGICRTFRPLTRRARMSCDSFGCNCLSWMMGRCHQRGCRRHKKRFMAVTLIWPRIFSRKSRRQMRRP